MALSSNEVLEQSKAAFRQWEPVWRENAKINGELFKKIGLCHKDLLWSGAGRTLLCIASAPSFEKQIDVILNNQNDSVDIACVDKCMPDLLKRNIKPQYVFIADSAVSYKEYCEPYLEETKDIILCANITANTEWTLNWKGTVIFYVNKDNIQSEKIFSEISGCNELIPASSNVGNTVIVFCTQILGHDEFLLLGYDFGWADDENYYSFNDSVKRYWMRHIQMLDRRGEYYQTSQNLMFSARWLSDFYANILKPHNVKIYNCSNAGILNMPFASLEKKLKSAKIRKLTVMDKNKIIQMKGNVINISANEPGSHDKLKESLNTLQVTNVLINYVSEDDARWISTL